VRTLGTIAALCAVLAAAALPQALPARDQSGTTPGGRDLLERMIRIVMDNNPTLQSQQALVRTGDGVALPRSRFALSSASINVGSTFWNADTNTFEVTPGATFGFAFSFADPARALSRYNLEKAKADAREQLEATRNDLVKALLDGVGEIVKLDNKQKSLGELQAYLEDLADAIEKQGKAGIVETDKLWDLRERIMGTRSDARDAGNQLEILRLQTARTLGGPAWQDLLALLERLTGGV
jgi:outer membrane protein TolC